MHCIELRMQALGELLGKLFLVRDRYVRMPLDDLVDLFEEALQVEPTISDYQLLRFSSDFSLEIVTLLFHQMVGSLAQNLTHLQSDDIFKILIALYYNFHPFMFFIFG